MQEEINPPRGLDEFSTGIWCWTDNRMDLIFFGEALHIFLCKRTKGLTCTLFSWQLAQGLAYTSDSHLVFCEEPNA